MWWVYHQAMTLPLPRELRADEVIE
jgi:hypothetical protein